MELPKSSHTDLLIIGAGPAGLMAAAWASKFNISARIIDDKPSRIQNGHADGLTCRTMEILDSFGLAETVVKESFHDIQMRSWGPSESGEEIERKATVLAQKVGASRFRQCTLHQGRLEQLFEELLEQSGRIKVERSVKTLQLRLDANALPSGKDAEYPVTLKVQHHGRANTPVPTTGILSPLAAVSSDYFSLPVQGVPKPSSLSRGNEVETIHAKYLIGCDGAHSWTRRQLGVVMKGENSDVVWGVMDIVPLTDFPDIRQTCAIYSRSHGGIHLVPREGKLVRFYIQLTEISVNTIKQGRLDRSNVTPQLILRNAQKILAPYTLNYRVCDWWSVYQVGQRIADHFDMHERVFFAGDAIHTHSPKIGQGMNVSFQDTYNLGWKVCSVIAGIASPKILRTYESERRQVALELLKNDQAANKYYSLLKADAKPTEPREDLQTFRNKMYGFLSGVAVEYGHSLLVQKEGIRGGKGNIVNSTGDCDIVTGERDGAETSTHQELARRIPMGQRMPPFKVLNHASARPTNIAELLPSTGHWRILVFAGDLTVSTQFDRLKKLGTALAGHRSFFQRYSRPGWQPIELFTIIAGARDDTPLMTLPPIFHPYDEELGWDYSRVFSDEVDVHDGRGDAYERYGIDRRVGCVVCCRPDQHVGYIGALDDDASLEEYFGRVMG